MNDEQHQAEKELQEILNEPFFALIFSLYNSAMISMGHIPNPVTNKAEMDLDQAQVTIDMLGMLKDKTTGNLNEKEQRFIDAQLAELRLGFTEAVKQEQKEKK